MNTPRFFHTLLAGILALAMLMTPTYILAKSPPRATVDISKRLERANKLLEFNGISRAAVIYEEVLREDPTHYPDVAFVLGQIYEHKQEHARATLFFATYLAIGQDEAQQQAAREAIERLRQPGWSRLYISPPDKTTGTIVLNDLYILSDGSRAVELFLPPAQYTISVNLLDHHRESYDIALDDRGIALHPQPESYVFFGYLNLRVMNNDHATITITQEHTRTSKGVVPTQHFTGTPPRALELPTGTYLIEITGPEHERWVRRVQIERDLDSTVAASLTRALPPEIRFDDLRHEEMKGITQRDAMRLINKATQHANVLSHQVATGKTSRTEALDEGPKPRLLAIY